MVRTPIVRILGHKRLAYLNQYFVIPKMIVDDRLANEGFGLKRIQFARLGYLDPRLNDSTIDCCVDAVLQMRTNIVRAQFKGTPVLLLSGLPVPVILPTYSRKHAVGFAVRVIQPQGMMNSLLCWREDLAGGLPSLCSKKHIARCQGGVSRWKVRVFLDGLQKVALESFESLIPAKIYLGCHQICLIGLRIYRGSRVQTRLLLRS